MEMFIPVIVVTIKFLFVVLQGIEDAQIIAAVKRISSFIAIPHPADHLEMWLLFSFVKSLGQPARPSAKSFTIPCRYPGRRLLLYSELSKS
jgi:hypothetical protein